ncbi:hypothetical protein [Polycladomyces subterraneus]|uniref:Uncharacterized protein n=1 Tax=Polycladomyces subterraneus TaxID=1016997 RepID=A0ABT8IP23_9BACL|nr:hypothetical protein [Polycladomyces subterraneus]MDN4594548.1 hypothetical protein [Polycladomyces subterraneus]
MEPGAEHPGSGVTGAEWVAAAVPRASVSAESVKGKEKRGSG